MNKFNQHLLQHDATEVLMVASLSDLRCETMFYIGGLNTDNNGNYQLINEIETSLGIFAYDFPLNRATVMQVSWSPTPTDIYINDKKYDCKSLIGVEIKKGDKIKAKYKPNSLALFILNAVLSVPVTPVPA